MAAFEGFPPDLFDFLVELTANNDRDWFNAHKDDYERALREPARAFVRAMGERLEKVAPHLVADDRRAGGSLMRIYRDTRFSGDKTPYKTNVGIQFRHEAGKDVHAPGLYVHFDLEEAFVGAGMWMPPTEALNAIRAKIDAEPERWTAITRDPTFVDTFRQSGDSLKRPPRGFDKDHPLIEDLKRKSFILVHDLDPADAESPELVDRVTELMRRAKPYCDFICEAVGLPF
jgi:uncharacterized protein (TIGR02453 family)